MTTTRAQVKVTSAVVEWYLATHFGSPSDPGLPAMFFDSAKVGIFATTPDRFAKGDSDALHRVLVAMIMFQRRQDVQIARILRGMNASIAREIMSPRRLLRMVDESACERIKTTGSLHATCDLRKEQGSGTCGTHPELGCHLKRHTVALKRYGHFGKFPTSAALVLRELRVQGLADLYKRALADENTPEATANRLQAELSRIWRVSDKIGAMFLSAVSNPDLGAAPWSNGVDWTKFVVIDSNVDLFLKSLGYSGAWTYAARHEFVTSLAQRIDLRGFNRSLHAFNPRLVQQAMYLFMSAANRRSLAGDCRTLGQCADCPRALTSRCPVQVSN